MGSDKSAACMRCISPSDDAQQHSHLQLTLAQVPVVNSSDQMVYVTANMQGGDAFTGPKDIMVGPGQTASYPLTFCAPWVGDYTGSLELTFPASGWLHVCV